MSKATEPRNPQRTNTESTANQTRYRVTYQNGSGHRVINAVDYFLNDHGHLVVQATDGRRHIFSTGDQWHLAETPEGGE